MVEAGHTIVPNVLSLVSKLYFLSMSFPFTEVSSLLSEALLNKKGRPKAAFLVEEKRAITRCLRSRIAST